MSSQSSSKSSNISDVRTKLNKLDADILDLLAKRRTLSGEVAESKQQQDLPLRDVQREEELLVDCIKAGRERGLDAHFITRVFHEIIDDSVRQQQNYFQRRANSEQSAKRAVKIGFHGIEGSYSYLAAGHYAARSGDLPIFVGCKTFAEAVKGVENGSVDYALLPVENSLSGANNEVYDLLLSGQVSLVGEEKLEIKHCLNGVKGTSLDQIKQVYCSGLAAIECRSFIANLPGVKIELWNDSATAALQIKNLNDRSIAVIASEEAASLLGLDVLKREIANQSELITRYVVIARNPRKVDLRLGAKTSIIVATTHQPGSLFEALAVFKENAVNLTKLESRSVPNNPHEQMFYIDFDGNLEDGRIQRVLTELTKCTRFIKVLGCYPCFDLPRTGVNPLADSGNKDATVAPVVAEQSGTKPATTKASIPKGYKLGSRAHKESDTIIEVKGIKIGGDSFVVMAGPCSVESYDQIMDCAREAKENGAQILRGGCFKPRTNPYSFQGLGLEGLDFMVEAGKRYNLPVITEVMAEEELDAIAEKADILQVGARNMQNYSLLKALGRTRRPVMLKRGLSAPLDELLQATEYILAGGNQQVMLCERGIRTFETATRSTLDLSAVPVLKSRTHLPIIVDPSHAAGERDLVPPLAMAAKAVGAHGIIIEFHPEPEKALSDGPQALRYPQFEKLMRDLYRVDHG